MIVRRTPILLYLPTTWLTVPHPQQASQERLLATPFGLHDPGLVIVGSSSHPSKQTEEFISLFNKPEIMQVCLADLTGSGSKEPIVSLFKISEILKRLCYINAM